MTENWMNWNDKEIISTLEEDWLGHMEQRRTLHEVLASLPDDLYTLLDAGCGTAITYEHFKDRFNYRGIDITPMMIEKTKEKFPEIYTYVKDILDLSEEDKADIVLSSDVLLHTPSFTAYLNKLWETADKVLVLKLAYIWEKPTRDDFDGRFYNRKFKLTDLVTALLDLKPYKLEVIAVEDDERTADCFSNYQVFVLWKEAP